ncbi:hypothetical protein [Reichenbachiella versicolor]|uniref:hypothetical protein n=1 Tax=Reichenbachiella versicolor TaxID=1821036 RepID=UPI000D6E6EDB|nr:hypothetical protein [Reichenbachiella versicolor]
MDTLTISTIIVFSAHAAVFIFSFSLDYFSKSAIELRRLKRLPLKSISEVKDNEEIKIIGNIEHVNSPLIAPLSKRQCSHYYVLVEEVRGRHSAWTPMIEEEKCVDHLISDGHSHAVVRGGTIKSHIEQDKIYSLSALDKIPESLEQYLLEHGQTSEGFLGLFNKKLRFKEGILNEGSQVSVFGKGKWITEENIDGNNKVLEVYPQYISAVLD